MNPATDIDREAIERFAMMSPAEQAAVMARAKRIRTVEDLDGLSEKDAEWFRPSVESWVPAAE